MKLEKNNNLENNLFFSGSWKAVECSYGKVYKAKRE